MLSFHRLGDACAGVLTPSNCVSLMSVSSLLRLSGSVFVTGRRRTGWPDTAAMERHLTKPRWKFQRDFREGMNYTYRSWKSYQTQSPGQCRPLRGEPPLSARCLCDAARRPRRSSETGILNLPRSSSLQPFSFLLHRDGFDRYITHLDITEFEPLQEK